MGCEALGPCSINKLGTVLKEVQIASILVSIGMVLGQRHTAVFCCAALAKVFFA
jgi:hypothetical protein